MGAGSGLAGFDTSGLDGFEAADTLMITFARTSTGFEAAASNFPASSYFLEATLSEI
jgi:hypothetical protein